LAAVKLSLRQQKGAGQSKTSQKRAGNPTDLFWRSKGESRRVFRGGLGGQEDFLIGDIMGRRSLRHKGRLEVVDDPVHYGIIGKESDNLHLSAAWRALRFIMRHLAYLLAEKR
jgi:hypothetical protein